MVKLLKFLKQHRAEIIVFIGIVGIFFFSRLYRLMSLPIFTDEAIYSRWAQVGYFDASARFASLTDGKQPLFIWLTTLLMQVVPSPLASGRLVSVASGFFTLVGLFFLARLLFKNTWVGIFSSAFYVFFPMSLVYDRMALYESLTGSLIVWSLYLEVLLVRKLRFDVALGLAMVIGAGLLTKTSAFFSLYLFPLTILLFDFSRKKKKRLLQWVFFAGVTIAVSLLYYSVLRLSPLFYMIYEKNSLFIYHLRELIPYHALQAWPGNLILLSTWLLDYFTLPALLLIASSFFSQKYMREKIFLLLWFLIPFVFLGLFGRILHSRFFFFMTLPLLPLGVLTLWHIDTLVKRKAFIFLFFLLIFSLPFRSDYYILTNFAKAPIPAIDLDEYINNWSAGGGVREIVAFLQKQSLQQKISVVSEGGYGNLSATILEIYFGHNANVEKQAIWPIPSTIPLDLVQKAQHLPVYIIFNQVQKPPIAWPLQRIGKYQKGMGNVYMSLYQVIPEKVIQ